MTTILTNTEGTLNQQPQEEWGTSGAASPWQILTSSNAAFVAAPSAGTMPVDVGLSLVIGLERLDLQPPKLDEEPVKEQLPLFSQDPMQHALLNLLTYCPQVDQPSDQDVGFELDYRFPL